MMFSNKKPANLTADRYTNNHTKMMKKKKPVSLTAGR